MSHLEQEQAAPTPPATGADQHETLSPERARQARALHRSYYRWLRLSRLVIVAFFAVAVVFFFWITPWLPGGLDRDDYTSEVAFTVYLLAFMGMLGIIGLALRARVERMRESLLAWSAVYDEATGLHTKTYFYDRLAMECERAARGGGVFTVVVLQVRALGARRPVLSHRHLQRLAERVSALIHRTDLVAMLSGNELAVLAVAVGKEEREELLTRLRGAVAAELPRLLGDKPQAVVGAGAATYGAQGTEPGALAQAARASAAVGNLPRTQAA